MKILMFLIIIFFSSISLFSQEIPKGANKIIGKITLKKEDIFILVGQALIDNGFQIDKKDKDFYTIDSAPKDVKGNSVIINCIIKDSLLIFTGKMNINISTTIGMVTNTSQYSKIEFKGFKNAPLKLSFMEMDKVIKSIKGMSTIQYFCE